jgi:hypothetical protein
VRVIRRRTFLFRLLAVYFSGSAILLITTLWMTRGHFSYSLDDAYIHLALAQQIAHGHYGLNASEPSSPSSSILWPFLIAPLSRTGLGAWFPLILNLGFGVLACTMIGRIVERWWISRNPEAPVGMQWLIAFLLILVANLFGLTFMGMEHVLQIALVSGCAYGLLEAYEGRPIPPVALFCAALAPSVRYEDLAFTLPVVLSCWFQGRRSAALLTGGCSLIPLAGFSLFLHRDGLPWLPTSVLVKGGVIGNGTNPIHRVVQLLRFASQHYILDVAGNTILLMGVVLLFLAWSKKANTTQKKVLSAAALGVWLVIGFGPYGWFYRYEVCVRIFATLILLGVLCSRQRVSAGVLATSLAVAGSPYIAGIFLTPIVSTRIYRQQFQMHRFADEFYHGNVAVNDLGWVSYDHGDKNYVLDLWGLGSTEAAMQGDKSTAWMEDIARRHDVGLVMIYPKAFADAPRSWVEIGVIHQRDGLFLGGGMYSDVSFYATPQSDLPTMQRLIGQFASTMPPETWLTTQ